MPAALLLASEGGFTVTGPHVITSFELFGMTWNLTETVFIQWIVMLVLLVVMLILTHKMEVIPKTKRQAAAEWLVTFVRNMVDTTMGPNHLYRCASLLPAAEQPDEPFRTEEPDIGYLGYRSYRAHHLRADPDQPRTDR